MRVKEYSSSNMSLRIRFDCERRVEMYKFPRIKFVFSSYELVPVYNI